MLNLRPYQAQAENDIWAALDGGTERLICTAPTGTGKTELAMSIIRTAESRGWRASFIADRRSLVQQTSRRFWDAGIEHGILMGKDSVARHSKVRIESAQTIQSRGLRAGTDLYIVDECHEQRPEMLRQMADSGGRIVGLTATPFPQGLNEPFGPNDERKRYQKLICTLTTDKAIADGWLCPFDVIAPEAAVDMSGVKVVGGEFHKGETTKRIMRIVGSIVPTWREVLEERYGGQVRPTIAFGASVHDAEAMRDEFGANGVDARIVSSKQPDDINHAIINDFRDGRFDVLVNCAMLSRGSDFPRAELLIDAYPMRRILTPIQRYGRVMRLHHDKKKAVIIDHAENWIHMREKILSFYTAGPKWPPSPAMGKNAREKHASRDCICRECRTVIPQSEQVCPNCGAPRPVRKYGGTGSKLQRVDGKLSLIDSVTGAVSEYGGDLWAEICTLHYRMFPTQPGRRRGRSLAAYRQVTGDFPPRGTPEQLLDRPCDPAVALMVDEGFKAWRRAKMMEGVNR